jgi:CheY-like chemotaxis protein
MSLYCQNCGALNAQDRIRCSACFQSLVQAKSESPEALEPPWSKAPPERSAPPMSKPPTGSRRPSRSSSRSPSIEPVSQTQLIGSIDFSPPASNSSTSSVQAHSTAERLWSLKPNIGSSQHTSLAPISLDNTSPTAMSEKRAMQGIVHEELVQTPSRTLAPERLAQLYETPQVFIFGSGQELNDSLEERPKMRDRVQDLISFCDPLLTEQVKEASIFLAFELPPRSWLQALNDLRPDGEILIWLSQWPEGKTGTQLGEGRTSAFFYGEEGLIELAVTLYRLAPFPIEERPHDTWWSEVHLRASLVEVEHFQRLLSQAEIDHYLITLFAQRMRRWARVAKDPLWVRLAQSSQLLSNYLSQGQHTMSALQFSAPAGGSIEEVFYAAEDLLCHELLSRSVTHRTTFKVACVTTLRSDHPELGELLQEFGAEVMWFKHPQALLERISEQYFHWCFLTEYVGPWDGFDLAQEARSRAGHLKISISVFARRTHILARAEHLNVDLLLYPSDPTSYQVITLNRALRSKGSGSSGGQDGLLKRLSVIQEAQKKQGLPQRTGILILHTGSDAPWLPQWIQELELLRLQHMPKSLAALNLNENSIAFPLAIDHEEPVKAFLLHVRSTVLPDLVAGAILNQGIRAPESSLADGLRRLDWSLIHGLDLTLGWWRSGVENTSSLGAHGAQMLIVDADPTSSDLLRYFSERAGLMVNALNSGKAAVELLERLQYPPQLLVVECTLPYIDGFQVLEACQKLENGRPKVIMTSALKRDDLIERAFENGANDFIYKPYNMAEVMARVIHALA